MMSHKIRGWNPLRHYRDVYKRHRHYPDLTHGYNHYVEYLALDYGATFWNISISDRWDYWREDVYQDYDGYIYKNDWRVDIEDEDRALKVLMLFWRIRWICDYVAYPFVIYSRYANSRPMRWWRGVRRDLRYNLGCLLYNLFKIQLWEF